MIEKPSLTDVPKIKQLMAYYPQDVLQMPLFHIYTRIREFFVAKNGGEVIGCIALRVFWDDLAEIRSLCVHPDYRTQGIGTQLVKAAVDDALELGIKNVFTLTRSPEFFKKNGFKIVRKKELPIKVFLDCLNCPKYENGCDEVAMVKRL